MQSPQDFRTMLRAGLPPGDAVTSVKFLGIERWHGSDGTTVFEASYEVLSSDDFQPKCNLGVRVTPVESDYRVRRFTVSTPPDE